MHEHESLFDLKQGYFALILFHSLVARDWNCKLGTNLTRNGKRKPEGFID